MHIVTSVRSPAEVTEAQVPRTQTGEIACQTMERPLPVGRNRSFKTGFGTATICCPVNSWRLRPPWSAARRRMSTRSAWVNAVTYPKNSTIEHTTSSVSGRGGVCVRLAGSCRCLVVGAILQDLVSLNRQNSHQLRDPSCQCRNSTWHPAACSFQSAERAEANGGNLLLLVHPE